MNYVTITDIFGNKISKDDDNKNLFPFILLHTKQPHLLMERVNSNINKKSGVWKLVYPTIMHILYNNGFNVSSFAPLGHIWYSTSKLPNEESILLVNTGSKISKYPIDYKKIMDYEKFGLWKPIGPRGYHPIGYLLSKGKPSKQYIRVINKDLLTPFRDDSKSVNGLSNMNEFKLLTYYDSKKITIKRTKILNKDYLVKIISNKNNKIISKNNSGKLLLDNDTQVIDDYQAINYSIQGELRMGNECIGVSINDNVNDKFVYLQECNDNDGQKWFPYLGHFVSQYDGSCLDTDDKNLLVSKCKRKKGQEWKTNNLRTVISKHNQEYDKQWKTRHGKNVVLLQPDNPWYVRIKNKQRTPEGIVKQNIVKLNETEYRANADVHSKFMLDTNNPSMGYGYSLEQRKGRPCSCLNECHKIPKKEYLFETFNDKSDTINFNLVACILLVLVIALVIIRLYSNYKTI